MDITFISTVASASDMSLLSAVQILRINIIMDTFAALTLAMDPVAFTVNGNNTVQCSLLTTLSACLHIQY